jgi:outer membrane protein insertion porin family
VRLHANLGFARRFGSTQSLPFYEHYYAGGIGSVRGYKESSLGPRSTPAVADFDQDELPFGGNIKMVGGGELIFPVPFIKDQQSLLTVLFVDVGNVYDTYCTNDVLNNGADNPGCGEVDLASLRYSAGIGLSWLTALGPLGFSLAAPLNSESEDDTQVFQFTLGQTF